MVDDWKDARQSERSASYMSSSVGTIKKHFADWMEQPANAVTPQNAVLAIQAAMRNSGPIAANRALAYARAVYGWALRRHLVDINPFRLLEMPGRERPRDRVLLQDEIAAIWIAAAKLPLCYSSFVRTLLLTLQRRDEVAGMRWSELSADFATWTIPAARAKNNQEHLVHLADPVRHILRRQTKVKDCPFVFASDRLLPVCAFSKTKRALDTHISAARKSNPLSPVDLPGWVMHDFRRTGVTTLADLGYAPHVCDALLNHVSAGFKGVQAVYQRARFLPDRKAALDAWATYVLAAAASGSPVVSVSIEGSPGPASPDKATPNA